MEENKKISVDESSNVNKIKINKIIEEYNKRTSGKIKYDYLKNVVIINEYISYAKKIALADSIIKVSSFDKNNNIKIDSCKRYILYIYTLIANYTNIDIDEDKILEQYDLLDSNNMLEVILSLIPEKEKDTFKTMIEMKHNDLMINQYETHAYITKKINDIYPDLLKPLTSFIEKIGKKLETLDEKQIEKSINKLAKYIK